MKLRILGPIDVQSNGRPVQLGGPRQRGLLTYLLLHANEAVSADRLLDQLWADPPRGGVAALQTQIYRLRRELGDRILTTGRGYAIKVEPGELDLDAFRSLLAAAGSTDDPAQRARMLREADALWYGEPLAGLGELPFARGEAGALEELRVGALEDRLEADLERGLDAALVPELSALVARYPLRERLRGELILALYRSGRQADALEAYRETRRMLDEELGLEPSPALRELEVSILRHDPALGGTAAAVEAVPMRERRHSRRWLLAIPIAALAVAGGAVATTLALTTAGSPRLVVAPPTVARSGRHTRVRTTRRRHAAPATPKAHHTVVRAPTTTAAPAAVTTAAAAPAPAPAPKPTPKPKAVATPVVTTPPPTTTIADDFSEATPNMTIWNIGGDGTGQTWTLQNGTLVFTVPADGTPGGTYNMIGPTWSMRCRFDGDFDERIDYQLLVWPPGGGAHMQLSAWIFPDLNSAAGRMVNQYGDQYTGNIGQHFTLLDTHDVSGTVRLARKGGVATAYYLSGGDWVAIQSGTLKGQAQLGLQLFGMANEWTHQEMQVAFDNFTVTGSRVVCP
jgi:DNA-binding SARP family transcriptional activator